MQAGSRARVLGCGELCWDVDQYCDLTSIVDYIDIIPLVYRDVAILTSIATA